uniref:Alpha-2-macroglobulin n=1 Tax=Castor canadensis TaxID=51338 RepID=A0A8C0XD05_CASCN
MIHSSLSNELFSFQLFACFLSLLLLLSSTFTALQYMVLVPSKLHTEIPQKSCLHLYHLNETVTVSAFLESSWGNKNLFDNLVVDKDLFKCISFTLPRSSSSEEVVFFSVHIKGPTHEFRKKTVVLIKNKESVVFVQTDKPMYKPGQSVKFRIVSVDKSLRPLHELVSLLCDPKMNRIMQWQNIELENGLKQLSFSLSSEPIQGSYKIVTLKQSGKRTEHSFIVEEFVLPKFEVQVKVPKVVNLLDEEVNVTVCGIYTYGKPVPGHHVLLSCSFVFIFLTYQLDSKGCITHRQNTSVFQLMQIHQQTITTLQVNAKITEEGTGLEFTGNGKIEITRILTKLEFVKVDSHFRRGIPIFAKVRLTDAKEVPIPHKEVLISVPEIRYFSNATTDQHGLAEFSINTTNTMDSLLTIKSFCVDYYCRIEENIYAYHVAYPVFSFSKSYVHLKLMADILPCDQIHIFQAHYTLNGHVLGEQRELIFYYLVMAKGRIIQSGTHTFPMEPKKLKGQFALEVPIQPDMSPVAQMFLYAILPDGEVIADVAKFKIENCLLNKVDLSFSPAQSLSASHIHLQVTASPQSLCALRAVDQSVLLLRPEAELSPSWVILKRTLFSSIVMIVAFFMTYDEKSDTKIYEESPTETARKYFPETWIWDLVLVNSSGVTEVGVTVPDTITEWKAGAFCLSNDTGLGFSPTVSFQAFQPFFVELTMPYSVIHGEAFTLKATVSNYLPECIRVSVQLEASSDFVAIPVVKHQDSYCLCANGRQTVSWLVTPKSLGNVNVSVSAETQQSSKLCGTVLATVPEIGKKDTIVKLLIVETSWIIIYIFDLFLYQDAGFSEKLPLKLPPKVVKDSARAYFSVLGDILGSAIQNIQNLLQMPYGCGEQNMVLFAPNIYVLKYLNETQQLTQEVKSKAIEYLLAGYQRELNYKHQDGSYSAFGDEDGLNQGNTWLTAFVLKSFAQARAFIFIDETHIAQALNWLSEKQKDNGCFTSSGSLFNNAMKGGVEDEVTLSAYVAIALLEIPLPVTHPVVHKALICLESAWETIQNGDHGSHAYTKALLAYVFALAGNKDKKNEILKSLDKEAVKEDNSVHWERPQKPSTPVGLLYQPPARSAEVEMTAYVLLSHLTAQPAPTPEDLTSAAHIVKWITKQQNSHGGFSSTQDTVVALHALSRYGAATFAKSGKASLVTIQSSGTFSTKFQVDNSNRLLLQQVTLPDLPGDYDINVSGEGCMYTQTALKYNVLLEKKQSAFTLQVQTVPQTCDGLKAHKSFQISLEVSYTGSRPVSNMVIVDVKMVSGFIPLKTTVKLLTRSSHMSRTEVSSNNVLIYLDQVTSQTLSFSFTVQQDIPVRNLKPALVKVYDYYETGEQERTKDPK